MEAHISGKIAKWAKSVDVQMKCVVLETLDPISIPSFLYTF